MKESNQKETIKLQDGKVIPEKFDYPLKRADIPTNNKTIVIDNYSPNYNYIVEGDKVYYALKGRDYWVDISENAKARQNLLNFIRDKYDFRGYEDNEREIAEKVNSGTFDYHLYRNQLNSASMVPKEEPKKEQAQEKPKNASEQKEKIQFFKDNIVTNGAYWYFNPDDYTPVGFLPGNKPEKSTKPVVTEETPKGPTVNLRNLQFVSDDYTIADVLSGVEPVSRKPVEPTRRKLSWREKTSKKINDAIDSGDNDFMGVVRTYRDEGFGAAFNTIKNGLSRRWDKAFMNNEETPAMDPPDFSMGDSEYGLLPLSFTGDTIRYRKGALPREYFIPESIDMNSNLFGVRNRGDLTELNTEGAIVTAFHEFVPYNEKRVSPNRTYIGIDSNGHFKAGTGADFGPGDMLTPSFSNKVYSFKKDANGNYVFKNDARHSNPNQNLALANVEDEKTGNIVVSGAVNVLVNKNDPGGNTYGSITGGRVLVKVGNEFRLLSGSLSQIEAEFEKMKARQHTDYGIFYTLDNGSYNKALRTYDRRLTRADLANYDHKNRDSGGNFAYLLPQTRSNRFQQDTVLVPTIRTVNDASYKKGHPLNNANRGVVLHYTAFSDGNDPTGVTNHFMNPANGASAHALILPNGNRRIFADENAVTFHAGQSTFNGVDNVNDFMHGIEFQAPGPNTPLTQEQVESAVEYLERYIRKYNIPIEAITTHEVVRNNFLQKYAGQKEARGVLPKSDLSPMQYAQIINALKARVYYRKQLEQPEQEVSSEKCGGKIKRFKSKLHK